MQVLRLMLKIIWLDSFAYLQQANNSNPDVVKALISAGAKVNAKTKDGLTPLHFAALKTQTQM